MLISSRGRYPIDPDTAVDHLWHTTTDIDIAEAPGLTS